MAVKKSELYRSLWAQCDALRGGMDASQYKDYVLVLLFMKYISDRHQSRQGLMHVPDGCHYEDIVALAGTKDIGEQIDLKIAAVAKANDLVGVIDLASFNDNEKLGDGQEMQDRLSDLVREFDKPAARSYLPSGARSSGIRPPTGKFAECGLSGVAVSARPVGSG